MRYCGKECPPRRLRWCSDECVEDYKLRTDPRLQRARVRDRDRGVCALCGLDTGALLASLSLALEPIEDAFSQALPESSRAFFSHEIDGHGEGRMGAAARLARQQALGLVRDRWNALLPLHGVRLGPCDARPSRSLWEADHVIPVVEGGGDLGVSNLRTLCVPCHRRETAALAGRRARARRAAR